MVKKMNSNSVLDRIDRYYRDCQIICHEVCFERNKNQVQIPLIAPDPRWTSRRRLLFPFVEVTTTYKKWILTISHVEDVIVETRDGFDMEKNVELGSIVTNDAQAIRIEGQYCYALTIVGTAMVANFEMTDETVRVETAFRLGWRMQSNGDAPQ